MSLLAAQRFFGPDCSIEAHPLEFGKSLQMPESNFEYEYFMLPDITPDMLAKHNTEVRLEVTYSSSAYTEWAAARPELLLLKASPPAGPSVPHSPSVPLVFGSEGPADLCVFGSRSSSGPAHFFGSLGPVYVGPVGWCFTVPTPGPPYSPALER